MLIFFVWMLRESGKRLFSHSKGLGVNLQIQTCMKTDLLNNNIHKSEWYSQWLLPVTRYLTSSTQGLSSCTILSIRWELLSLRLLNPIGWGDFGCVSWQAPRRPRVGCRQCQEGNIFHAKEAGDGNGIGGIQHRGWEGGAHRCQWGRGRVGRLREGHVEVNWGRDGSILGGGFSHL